MKKKSLLESYTTMLTESVVTLDKEIEELLNRYSKEIDAITVVPPEHKNFTSCKLTDANGKLELIDVNDKALRQNVGKILKKLYPDIDVVGDKIVQKLILDLKQLSTNTLESQMKKYGVDVTVYDNIAEWYKKCADTANITSCVTGREDKTLSSYTKDPNIQIAIMTDLKTGELIGRALLWHNVEDTESKNFNTLLDRTYPGGDTNIHEKFETWGKINKYWVRTRLTHGEYQIIDNKTMKLRFRFELKPEDIKHVPYMDTFRNLYKSTNYDNLIGTNYRTNNRNWWADNTVLRVG